VQFGFAGRQKVVMVLGATLPDAPISELR